MNTLDFKSNHLSSVNNKTTKKVLFLLLLGWAVAVFEARIVPCSKFIMDYKIQ